MKYFEVSEPGASAKEMPTSDATDIAPLPIHNPFKRPSLYQPFNNTSPHIAIYFNTNLFEDFKMEGNLHSIFIRFIFIDDLYLINPTTSIYSLNVLSHS